MTSVVEATQTRRLPSAINYAPTDLGTVTRRERQYITPTGQGSFQMNANSSSGSTSIQFDLPKTGYIDSQTITLSFDATVMGMASPAPITGTETTTASIARLFGSAYNFFTRFRLLQGSEELMDIEHYNVYKNVLDYLWSVPLSQQKDIGHQMEGIAGPGCIENTTLNEILASTNPNDPSRAPNTLYNESTRSDVYVNREVKHYSLTLNEGIFSTYTFIPTSRLQQLTLKFFLEAFVRAFCTNGPLAGTEYYQIDNIKLYFDYINLPDDVDAAVIEAINMSAIKLHYIGVRSQSQSMTMLEETVKFTERVTSLKAVHIVAQPQSYISNPTLDTLNGTTGFGWLSHQFRILGEQYPPSRVDQLTDAFLWAIRACGFYHVPWTPGKPSNGFNARGSSQTIGTYLPAHAVNAMYNNAGTVEDLGGELPMHDYTWESVFDNYLTTNHKKPAIRTQQGGENYLLFSRNDQQQNKFMMSYDFDREEDPYAITGLNTANKQAEIECNIIRSDSSSEGALTLFGFVVFDAIMLIAPMGKAAIAK